MILFMGHRLMAGDNLNAKIKLLTGSLDVVVEKSFLCTYASLLLRYGNTAFSINQKTFHANLHNNTAINQLYRM